MTDTIQPTTDERLERYMQMWNEPDLAVRRALVEELWTADARNATLNMEAVGHDLIVARVTRSYDLFVGTGEHRFETHEPPVAHHGAVRVTWRMVTGDGRIAALGHEFLMLDDDGRIRSDHQFPVALPQ